MPQAAGKLPPTVSITFVGFLFSLMASAETLGGSISLRDWSDTGEKTLSTKLEGGCTRWNHILSPADEPRGIFLVSYLHHESSDLSSSVSKGACPSGIVHNPQTCCHFRNIDSSPVLKNLANLSAGQSRFEHRNHRETTSLSSCVSSQSHFGTLWLTLFRMIAARLVRGICLWRKVPP